MDKCSLISQLSAAHRVAEREAARREARERIVRRSLATRAARKEELARDRILRILGDGDEHDTKSMLQRTQLKNRIFHKELAKLIDEQRVVVLTKHRPHLYQLR